ncbi:MAG: hypothetical protein QXD62_03785, partial [Candidatus Woesearchaeota archaeon]
MNFLEKIRKELKEKRYLDTVIHGTIVVILYFSLLNFLNLPREKIFFSILLGSFIPDIDHLFLYQKRKFGNFKNFIKWIIKSDRYRIGFELFHNTPVMFMILLFLPYLYE